MESAENQDMLADIDRALAMRYIIYGYAYAYAYVCMNNY